MKLATLKNNSRDGALMIVSRDLTTAVLAGPIAPTLQSALEHWQQIEPELKAIYERLNDAKDQMPGAFRFVQADCHAPLPRAYQWVDGSAYLSHVELVRAARGATMPPEFKVSPLMYQGGSDSFIGPHDDIAVSSEEYGIDLEAEIAVITDDVPMATSQHNAAKHIKLLMLVNDVSLRNLIPAELAKGFGFFQSKPSSSFSPIAITPDELGASWQAGKVDLPLHSFINGKQLGAPIASHDMNFSFLQLIEHAAHTRPLIAGTIVGSGTVANYDASKGSSCLAEIRMRETLEKGAPVTPFLKFGDEVHIEMFNANNESIFGAIKQKIVAYKS